MEVRLSDGRIAKIRKGKGSDLFKAQRLASDPTEVTKLLLVFLTTVDGKPLTEEDLDNMPLEDTLALMTAFAELHPLSQTLLQPQPLSGKVSATQSSKK